MIKRIVLFLLLAAAVTAGGFAIGVFAVRVFATGFEPPAVRQGDFSEIVDSVGSPVVLLSTSTCPWCEKSRQWLRARNVGYRDCVVDENAHAAKMLERSGVGTVPQLLNARSMATTYDPEAFERIVREAPPLASTPATLQCAASDAIRHATHQDSNGQVPAGQGSTD